MKDGTRVNATIVEAPPSTKNAKSRHGPERRRAKQGNEWPFGPKEPVGGGTDPDLAHNVAATATNEPDASQTHARWRGHERETFTDAGYTGVDKRGESHAHDGYRWTHRSAFPEIDFNPR